VPKNRLLNSVLFRRLLQVALDASLIALAYWLAFVLRFDPRIPHRYEELLGESIAFVVVGKLVVFGSFGLYHKLWRFIDGKDFESIVRAVVVASVSLVGVFFLIPASVVTDPPRGVIALDFLITLTLIVGARFVVRAVFERPFRGPVVRRGAREVLIVGAGNGGQLVAAELRRNPELGGDPIGFVDDDPRKRGVRIGGLKVEGTTDELARVLDGAEPEDDAAPLPTELVVRGSTTRLQTSPEGNHA
jgi:FlaA1/EpsC-like NDP-sugar epimerase